MPGKDSKHGLAASVIFRLLLVVALIWSFGRLIQTDRSRPADKRAGAKLAYRLPAGGQTIFPNYRLVALYGTPGNPALGVLGAQSPAASVARVKALAAQYQPLVPEHILPTLEIITTIAAADPTDNGDYSQQLDAAGLQPWLDAARRQGVYVVLDLQPGRSDFLSQAKQYAGLLSQPNVGLALDPEWRLKPDEVPLAQIGSVSADEVNATAGWLAELTRQQHLLQKLFIVHEFRLSELPDRQRLQLDHPELAPLIQMDGQGDQSTKAATYQAVTTDPLPNVCFGWKNFYQKDNPVLTPSQTMELTPKPWYVSYQ